MATVRQQPERPFNLTPVDTGSFHVHVDVAERRVSVDCGGLVLPIHKSLANRLDDGIVRRILDLHATHVAVLVNIEVACDLPMPSRKGRFYHIHCAWLSESPIFICRSKYRLRACDA